MRRLRTHSTNPNQIPIPFPHFIINEIGKPLKSQHIKQKDTRIKGSPYLISRDGKKLDYYNLILPIKSHDIEGQKNRTIIPSYNHSFAAITLLSHSHHPQT